MEINNRLLKNIHLLRCAASFPGFRRGRLHRRTPMYDSFLSFCAPCIWTFLNSLIKIEFLNNLIKGVKP
ncbi:MAG: hypothetical protein CSYNP_02526 [Syntrophus sp. SKADARSKE-3]|nr:hypothetical protein [Syntrophus sp. SKADARSKE-3]